MKEKTALHIKVLHKISGRLRISLEYAVESVAVFEGIHGVTEISYNSTLKTLLVKYDAGKTDEKQILLSLGGKYVRYLNGEILHIKHSADSKYQITNNAKLSLAGIAVDSIANVVGSTLIGYTKWLSFGLTAAAIFEHGYEELKTRGNLDPEVMAGVYLARQISAEKLYMPSLIAWFIVFGRHITPKQTRETAYLVKKKEGTNKLYLSPIKVEKDDISKLSEALTKGTNTMFGGGANGAGGAGSSIMRGLGMGVTGGMAMGMGKGCMNGAGCIR